MAKQNLLLVDADLRSVRVLEVSLRKAGYNVASAGSARDALGMLEMSRPDLVLCDTRLPAMDGFELIQEIRRRPELAGIPLMILSSDVSIETKVRGLELGVEDYLTKPIYIKELLARVNIVLQRKRREGIERLEHGHKRKFSGSLSDMGVVDLLQAVDHNKKSGVLYLTSGSFDGAIYFCNGAPVDAAVGKLRGSRAIYRTLLWTDGTFEIDFREIDREDHVRTSMQAIVMEGLRRVDEWGRLLEQLPDLDTVFDVSDTQLIARLAEIPDQINAVLREFDGERSLWQIVDACEADDLETLSAVSKLYFEGLLYNTGRIAGESGMRDDGEESPPELDMTLPHISSGPPVITHTLAPAWPSVPSGDDGETQLIDDTLQLNIPATPKLPEGLRITGSESPKRRKSRKRKKRGGHSLPAAAGAQRKQPKPKPADPEVREVDETVAEITPSTIAPPPEEAENAAIVPAEQPAPAAVPATSKPPELPRSKPASGAAGTTTPPKLTVHDNPTLDLAPFRGGATPPALQGSGRPPLSAASDASPSLKSTTPPPLAAEHEAAQQDLHSDDETTETQVSLRTSVPPPRRADSSVPRAPATPPPLPYVSKPPSTGFGSPRGGTSPGFAAAPLDEETMAAAAAAISEAETAPPPFASRPAGERVSSAAPGADAPVASSLAAQPLAADELAAAESGALGSSRETAKSGRAPAELSPRSADSPKQTAPSTAATDSRAGLSQRPSATGSALRDFLSTRPPAWEVEPGPGAYAASMPARDFETAVLAAASSPPPEIIAGAEPGPASRSFDSEAPSSVAPTHPPPSAASAEPTGVPSGFMRAHSSAAPADEPFASKAEAEATAPDESATDRRDVGVPHSAEEHSEHTGAGAGAGASERPSAQSFAAGATSPSAFEDASGLSNSRDATDASSARPRTTDASSAGPRDASMPPLTAALEADRAGEEASALAAFVDGAILPPDDGDASARAARGATDAASARPPVLSVPPLPAASMQPAVERNASMRAGSSEADHVVSSRPRDLSVPPLAAASTPPSGDEAELAEASEEDHVVSSRPRDLSVPPLAAASTPPSGDEAELADASEEDHVVLSRPRDLSVPPLAAASTPPSGDDAGLADASEADAVSAERLRDFRAPALASASVAPSEGVDSELASGLSEGVDAVATESGGRFDSQRELTAPALAEASGPPPSMLDSTLGDQRAGSHASLLSLASSVPANDVTASAPAKPEEDFSDLDISDERSRSRSAAAPALGRASPPPLPAASAFGAERSESTAPDGRTSVSARANSSPPDADAAPRFGSPPPLAATTEPAPGAAAWSSSLPPMEDSHTEPGGYVAIRHRAAEDRGKDKRLRPPQQRTAVPPPFTPDAPSSAGEAPAAHAADQPQSHRVALAANSVPAPRSLTPELAKQSPPAQDGASSSAAETRAATSSSAAAPSKTSERAEKLANVISFKPRKRAEDAAAAALADATPSSNSMPARGSSQAAPPSSSGAPGASSSGAPSQTAPQAKRRISRMVQAGGVAAAVALAAGLFALRARDTAPQGSLNTALPEAVGAPATLPPPAAEPATQRALGELEALQKQAKDQAQPTAEAPRAAPAAASPSVPSAAEPKTDVPEADPKIATAEPAEEAQEPAAAEARANAPQAKAPAAQPAEPASGTQTSAAQALAKGRSLEQKGKKQDAINLYAKAIAQGVANSQLLSRMAFLYLNQGKNALAETHAQRAADADETNSEAWIVLGAAQDQLGKKQAAEQAYRSCAAKGQGQYVTECKRMLR